MALLRVFQEIDNDIWKLTFVNDPEYLSEGDKKLMSQFGEPEIDLGGTFLAETANEFTLPTKKAKVRSDFPYTSSFDSRDADFEENPVFRNREPECFPARRYQFETGVLILEISRHYWICGFELRNYINDKCENNYFA